jgi:hypothetical protein
MYAQEDDDDDDDEEEEEPEVFCVCKRPSYGEMIACDFPGCKVRSLPCDLLTTHLLTPHL